MEQSSVRCKEIVEICVLAGKIMLENGGETYRVEDTMMRIATAYGAEGPQSFVMPTGIMFAIEGTESATRLVRISRRSTNLSKVTEVNDISRRIAGGHLQPAEARALLKGVECGEPVYPLRIQLLLAALASGCFLILYEGTWSDMPAAMLCGGTGFWLLGWMTRLSSIRLFGELIAALAVGLLSYLAVRLGVGQQHSTIMIASVMPLVPGLLITNAVRDLMAGHLVSGISKGAEAFLTAFAIGAGIGIALTFNA
ncbi:threonine/serine exporter family protein [Cohnella sp. JJ-181]|uniref:threonine/serine exporter family protein n=1 Tax=Cohnella rhizoplanae TaxID=2974897 RepID=UPI0022FF80A1|nr:threonine/serine exporter family protein [Cohnella sp. JJ-181]CAI6081575.1 Inner membrane protein YjjP [Cohnella sp. JJ-181]